uniref:Glutaminyl-peptide cyclotransferase n=1 Tax=Triatoma infestans TaxID=30076 RepID=A0A023F7V8_TRIIF
MNFAILEVTTFAILLTCLVHHEALRFHEERNLHTPKALSNDDIAHLAGLTDEKYFKDVLRRILVPRIVGTSSHEKVKDFIASELSNLGFTTELDTFIARTPNFGNLQFTNIVGMKPANASRYLVLACHYDSKYFPDFEFYAATDSAVPCSMLLHIGKVLQSLTTNLQNNRVGLMLIFFDGEEAFLNWNEQDSLYGSRNLAAKWECTPYPQAGASTNLLHRIDLLVLLDLLGVKDQQLYSLYRESARWHSLLSRIERRLKALSVVPSDQPLHFLEKSSFGFIEDDHKPFLARNVPVLHLIPPEFPKVWHTAGDNYSALDFPTIDTLNKVLQVFVFAYLNGSHE